MPKVKEVIQYYKKKNKPIECLYCGSTKNLTKDHIRAKCKTPLCIRKKAFFNKDKNPDAYWQQFALACRPCNQMKSHMSLSEFLAHINRIKNWIDNYERNRPYYNIEINRGSGLDPKPQESANS